jgi:hypothetical protein
LALSVVSSTWVETIAAVLVEQPWYSLVVLVLLVLILRPTIVRIVLVEFLLPLLREKATTRQVTPPNRQPTVNRRRRRERKRQRERRRRRKPG